MRQTSKKTKRTAKKFIYRCSVYIRNEDNLELLREAASKSDLDLSTFLMTAALREARTLKLKAMNQG